MASAIKSKLAQATGTSSSDPLSSEEAEKYKLMVTAGPSYDKSQHRTVHVNSDQPTVVENEFLRAKIKVRIRNYHGLPSSSSSNSPYFDHPVHEKDQYSIAFSFVPKQDLLSVDTVWGNDFDHPVRDRLPPGFNTAFKIVKEFIDPGLSCDAYADEPWLYGPSLSCWFAFRVGENLSQNGEDFPAPDEVDVMTDGGDGSGAEIRQKLGIPDNNEKRRKHFLSAANREQFVFEKGRVYQGDFYNPYIDFGNFALKLPGFSLKVIKYVDQKSHCLRYVFKNRETGDVYFNINFHLLWGDKLEQALEEDKEHGQAQIDGAADSDGHQVNGHKDANDDTAGHEERQAGAGAVDAELPHRSSTREPTVLPPQEGPELATLGPTELPPQEGPELPSDPSVSDAQEALASTGGAAPMVDGLQLHPGDHRAVADYSAPDEQGVEEVTGMLQGTMTSDKREEGRVYALE